MVTSILPASNKGSSWHRILSRVAHLGIALSWIWNVRYSSTISKLLFVTKAKLVTFSESLWLQFDTSFKQSGELITEISPLITYYFPIPFIFFKPFSASSSILVNMWDQILWHSTLRSNPLSRSNECLSDAQKETVYPGKWNFYIHNRQLFPLNVRKLFVGL